MVLPYMDNGLQINSIQLLTAPSKCGHACRPQLFMVFIVWICKQGIIRQMTNRHTCSCTCVDIFKLYHQQPYNFSRPGEGQKIKIRRLFIKEMYFNIHEI